MSPNASDTTDQDEYILYVSQVSSRSYDFGRVSKSDALASNIVSLVSPMMTQIEGGLRDMTAITCL